MLFLRNMSQNVRSSIILPRKENFLPLLFSFMEARRKKASLGKNFHALFRTHFRIPFFPFRALTKAQSENIFKEAKYKTNNERELLTIIKYASKSKMKPRKCGRSSHKIRGNH